MLKDAMYEPSPDIFNKVSTDSGTTSTLMGRSCSGKTYFLVEMLNKLVGVKRGGKGPDKRRPMYDMIILFTESLSADPLKGLDSRLDVKLVKGFSPTIVRFLKQINDNSNNSFAFLIILDDVVTNIRGGTFSKQILTMRNANISTTILLQYTKLVTPAVRNSLHHFYFTGYKPEEWEYIIKSFLKSLVVELIGKHSPVSRLAEVWKEWVGDDIVHYDQKNDTVTFIKRELPER
jgi:hypothetical protein